MKVDAIRYALPCALLMACGADDHDQLLRLATRVTELEAKVHVLAQKKPPAPSPSKPTPMVAPVYDPKEPGWSLSGGGRDVYEVHPDFTVVREGHPTVRLEPTGATHEKYGTWARSLDASPYLGKRVRFTIYTKTRGTTQRADFWARVQAPDSPGDGSGLGAHWTRLSPDSDWARREIVLDVDRGASYFNYGVGIAGPGTLWFDAPTIEVVGADVPVTPFYEGEKQVGDWLMTGVGAPDFKLEADDKAVRIERTVESSQRFVAVVRSVPAAAFAGKTARATFDVKTEGLEGEGACIIKAQNERDLAYQGFLAFDMKKVDATTKGFTHCEVQVAVPSAAKYLVYGFTYRGAGKAWVRGGTLK